MKGIPLKAQIRVKKGSAESRRMRREGYIPAVFYGAEEETLPIKVIKHDFSKIIHSRSGEHSMVELQIEGNGEVRSELSIIREVQHDPVTDLIIHADFEKVHLGKPMEFTLPIEFVGEAIGVKKGGIFTPHLHEIHIMCKPKDAPEIIEINVSEIDIGSSLHIGDLSLANAEILNPPDETVASVIKPRIVSVEKEEIEEEAVEEAAEEKAEKETATQEQKGETSGK